MRASVSVRWEKDNGTVVPGSVDISTSPYIRETSKQFRAKVRRRAIEALNSVLGANEDVVVEKK